MKDGVETFMVMTANRLRDGSVVYMRREQENWGWTTDIRSATVFTEDEKEVAEAAAQVGADSNHVVGVYPIEIADKNKPISAREKIRAQGGPTMPYGLDGVGVPVPDYSI